MRWRLSAFSACGGVVRHGAHVFRQCQLLSQHVEGPGGKLARLRGYDRFGFFVLFDNRICRPGRSGRRSCSTHDSAHAGEIPVEKRPAWRKGSAADVLPWMPFFCHLDRPGLLPGRGSRALCVETGGSVPLRFVRIFG